MDPKIGKIEFWNVNAYKSQYKDQITNNTIKQYKKLYLEIQTYKNLGKMGVKKAKNGLKFQIFNNNRPEMFLIVI